MVSDATLAKRCGVTRGTPWRWARMGRIPKPLKMGPNCTRWVLADVIETLGA
jgi:prophage regulatory protein